MKKYILKHKDINVLVFEYDSQVAKINSIIEIINIEHLPFGVKIINNKVDRKSLSDWWESRCIPASRDGIRITLEKLNISRTTLLLEKAMGLSLSDYYWICPNDNNLKWKDINFFDNAFSEDLGKLMFSEIKHSDYISLLSPDNSSDGWLKKKWVVINNKRYLIKAGSSNIYQEPINEVIASKICDLLNIRHVSYTIYKNDNNIYSMCQNMLNKDEEYITAYSLINKYKKANHISHYDHFINCCENEGIPRKETIEFLDKLLTLDFIICNEDRHYNNFGLIRDVNTLKLRGFAPIFDNGTSLWCKKSDRALTSSIGYDSKPFKNNHLEQIKLVTNFDWLNVDKLNDIPKIILDTFSEINSQDILLDRPHYISKATEGIIKHILKRIKHLKEELN